jgi:hypothetical protein
MNKANRRKIERMLKQGRMPHLEIARISAVLYFPPKIFGELKEICQYNEYTPGQLMGWAFKAQEARWEEFVDEVMTPLKLGESEAWPEDPLYCLACVATIHFAMTFVKLMEDPGALEQMRKAAPAGWSFRSIEELEDGEPADWWKADEPE